MIVDLCNKSCASIHELLKKGDVVDLSNYNCLVGNVEIIDHACEVIFLRGWAIFIFYFYPSQLVLSCPNTSEASKVRYFPPNI